MSIGLWISCYLRTIISIRVLHGVPIIFTKKDIYDNVCPECETWCPFGSRTFWPIPDMLELRGIKVNSGWMYTMDTLGYFVVKKGRSNDLD